MTETKPILIFACGNLSRGDDALGPLFVEWIQSKIDAENVECLSDFQLQIEHALDLEDRKLVLFVDASVAGSGAFDFTELKPACDKSYTTHAMSPAAVLKVFQDIKQQAPPPCFLLSIQGVEFELGAELSLTAQENIKLAIEFSKNLIRQPDLIAWKQLAEN